MRGWISTDCVCVHVNACECKREVEMERETEREALFSLKKKASPISNILLDYISLIRIQQREHRVCGITGSRESNGGWSCGNVWVMEGQQSMRRGIGGYFGRNMVETERVA